MNYDEIFYAYMDFHFIVPSLLKTGRHIEKDVFVQRCQHDDQIYYLPEYNGTLKTKPDQRGWM